MNTIFKKSALVFSVVALIFSSCSKQVAYNPLTEPGAAQYVITKPVKAQVQQEITLANDEVIAEEKLAVAETPVVNEPAAYKQVQKNASVLAKVKNKAKKADKDAVIAKVSQVLPVFASAQKSVNKTMIDGNLRLAIIFLLLSLIVGLLPIPYAGLFAAVLAVIGLVFLILWILSVL